MAEHFSAIDHQFMARALKLAERGLYTTAPNPRVGCVLVKNEQIIGEGWHQRAGQLHAEPLAIIDARGEARGSTAYVTLEPCCHHGKTVPCTEGLIEAGVSRVVVAMLDPNPQVSGKGIARLMDAGIETAVGLLESQSAQLNPGFIKRMAEGKPWVRCKLAMSLDGRTAMASGESVWITGDEARQDVQRLRARSAAILTGSGTVLADDPSLNVRASAELLKITDGGEVLQPLRVVLDSRLSMSSDAKMLSLPGQTLIFHSQVNEQASARLSGSGAELQMIAGSTDVDINQVLQELARREINEVLIEAGPTLAGAALQAGVLDEIIIYMAPHLMGNAARGLFHMPGLENMADRQSLVIEDIRQVGEDFRITARPV